MDAINQPLLDVRDLSVAFGKTLAVDHVSFSIKRGECVALVGESGSGKSVSALSILKLLPYPSASHPSGQIRFRGRDLLTAAEGEMREIRGNDISIIFQEPMTSLNPLHTIEAQIGEILLLHNGISGQAARARTLELLTQVGIPDPETRLGSYPHQLSGGQRQRVMIAMALANEPDLLIADEPTTALDVTVQAQILALLADIQRRQGMSMLFITHDLGIVRRIADVVCVMNSGKIVEQGPVEEVFTAPKHAYTRALLAAEPKPDPAPPRPNEPVVISADNLKVWFPIKRGLLRSTVGHIKAVDGVSIAVRKGETLGVVGESGSGKTTLGLALLRLISSEGPIVFLGKDIQGLRFKDMLPFRRDMQIVFQDPFGSLSPRMSVGDIVAEGLTVHQKSLSYEEREARVVKALRDVGLDPETRFRYPHEFSGGQRQRISIARAVVLEPNFVVLDEPTSGPDGRPAARTAAQARFDLLVHLARFARGGVIGEPPDRDAPRQGGRGGPGRGALQEPEERLHPRAVCGGVPDRGGGRTAIEAVMNICRSVWPPVLQRIASRRAASGERPRVPDAALHAVARRRGGTHDWTLVPNGIRESGITAA
jgi:microcin C transport system ATP-binding protein